jgi:hypothetical protein
LIESAPECITFDADLALTQEHGQVVEAHCEVTYDWDRFIIFGDREGEGFCTYHFEDEFELTIDVEVGGGFITGGIVSLPMSITGSFDIVDDNGNALFLDEDGILTEGTSCGGDVCLDSDVTVDGGDGLFDDLDGEGTKEAVVFIETNFFFIFLDGYAESTIWIFFDCLEGEGACDPPVELAKNSGSSCTNCQPPTLGLDKKGDISNRLVDGGFKCRGQTVDVEHYYTPFPLIQTHVGQPLVCEFKVYEDTGVQNIRHFGFAIGDRAVSLDINHLGEQTLTYDEDFFRDASLTLRPSTVDCRADGTNQCAVFDLSIVPKEPIVGDDIVVQTTVWDQKRNGKTNLYNDGIDVIGNTENALPTFTVNDGRNGNVVLYTMDPTLENQTFAISELGDSWYFINGHWTKEYTPIDRSCDSSSSGFDRNCAQFDIMKDGQILLAQQHFNSADIQGELPDFFAYDYPEFGKNRLEGTQLRD